jgi:hypothetical protein
MRYLKEYSRKDESEQMLYGKHDSAINRLV